MKKGLSICLVISMLSTTSLTAMAQDVSKTAQVQNINIVSEEEIEEAAVSAELKNELKKDREQFSELGIIGIADEMKAEVEDDEIRYVLQSGEYETVIK